MLNTVKEIIYTVGDSTGTFAKQVGLKSADVAKQVGYKSADVARSIGSGTVDLAQRIGPKRALIGFAILAAAVGGSIVLVRYLRRRDEQARFDEESMQASDEARRARNSALGRAESRAVHEARANR